VKLDRATVCLPIKNRLASHTFYTALGFVTVGELGDDGLPERLQFEISAGSRVMLIPTRGFGMGIGGRKRSPRNAHECLVVIGLATDAAVDEPMRRAQDAGAEIVMEVGIRRRLRRPRRPHVAGQPRRRLPDSIVAVVIVGLRDHRDSQRRLVRAFCTISRAACGRHHCGHQEAPVRGVNGR